MNEYRIQRLKEDLTYAQQRNKNQKRQLANYKKVHEKDLKKIERLNNIIDKLEIDIEIGTGKYTYDTDYNRGLSDAFIYMNDRIKELKGENNE